MSYVATKAQVKALEILSRMNKQVPLKVFIKKMWETAVTPNFAKHFLTGLVQSNYVKRADSKEGETYAITKEGNQVLTRPEWRCLYCGLEFFEMPKRPSPQTCKRCGGEHSICKGCFPAQVIVGGRWPTWKPVLKNCPRGSGKAVKK
jgi:predicted transcriptional regulator